MIKLNVKKDRIEIAKILENNYELMYKSKGGMCQDVADAILLYFIEKKGDGG